MPDAFTTETTVDPVTELVGEGKKFKTVADLAKGKQEADTFIEQLKTEQAQLRAELAKKVDTEKTLQDLRTEIQQMKTTRTETPSPQTETTSSVSEASLKALIAKTITEAETQRSATQNVVSASNAVIKHYGSQEKAQEVLKAKAHELGLTVDELKATAAKSPTAFLKLILPEAEQRTAVSNLDSSVRSEALPTGQGAGPKEGTKEYFDEIFKKDRKKYFSAGVQQQIFKAAQAGTYDHQAGLSAG